MLPCWCVYDVLLEFRFQAAGFSEARLRAEVHLPGYPAWALTWDTNQIHKKMEPARSLLKEHPLGPCCFGLEI